jgi:hypothetical protein
MRLSRLRLPRLHTRLLAGAGMLICCLAPLPASAAARTYIPPGYAGASQYVEDLPTAGGNIAPPTSGAGTTSKALAAVGEGASGARQLERFGSLGRQAATFAQATAPAATGRIAEASTSGGAASIGASPDAASGSVSGGLASFLAGQDHGGLGVVLPVLLGLGVVGAFSVALIEHRRRPAGGDGSARSA